MFLERDMRYGGRELLTNFQRKFHLCISNWWAHRGKRITYLIQDEPAQLPLGVVGGSLVQVAGQRVVVVGPLRQHHQLVVVDADCSLHLRA